MKKIRSQYYTIKETNRIWTVVSKASRTGPKQIDDFVIFRGTKAEAIRKIKILKSKEKSLASKK